MFEDTTFFEESYQEYTEETKTYQPRLSEEDQLYILGLLVSNNLAAKVWPVYSWDNSPPIYLLLVDRDLALAEINLVSDVPPVTETQFRTVLKRYCGTEKTFHKAIQDFYASRKDRKTKASNFTLQVG